MLIDAIPALDIDALERLYNELLRIREATLAARDDAWLEAPLRIAPALNAHWA